MSLKGAGAAALSLESKESNTAAAIYTAYMKGQETRDLKNFATAKKHLEQALADFEKIPQAERNSSLFLTIACVHIELGFIAADFRSETSRAEDALNHLQEAQKIIASESQKDSSTQKNLAAEKAYGSALAARLCDNVQMGLILLNDARRTNENATKGNLSAHVMSVISTVQNQICTKAMNQVSELMNQAITAQENSRSSQVIMDLEQQAQVLFDVLPPDFKRLHKAEIDKYHFRLNRSVVRSMESGASDSKGDQKESKSTLTASQLENIKTQILENYRLGMLQKLDKEYGEALSFFNKALILFNQLPEETRNSNIELIEPIITTHLEAGFCFELLNRNEEAQQHSKEAESLLILANDNGVVTEFSARKAHWIALEALLCENAKEALEMLDAARIERKEAFMGSYFSLTMGVIPGVEQRICDKKMIVINTLFKRAVQAKKQNNDTEVKKLYFEIMQIFAVLPIHYRRRHGDLIQKYESELLGSSEASQALERKSEQKDSKAETPSDTFLKFFKRINEENIGTETKITILDHALSAFKKIKTPTYICICNVVELLRLQLKNPEKNCLDIQTILTILKRCSEKSDPGTSQRIIHLELLLILNQLKNRKLDEFVVRLKSVLRSFKFSKEGFQYHHSFFITAIQEIFSSVVDNNLHKNQDFRVALEQLVAAYKAIADLLPEAPEHPIFKIYILIFQAYLSKNPQEAKIYFTQAETLLKKSLEIKDSEVIVTEKLSPSQTQQFSAVLRDLSVLKKNLFPSFTLEEQKAGITSKRALQTFKANSDKNNFCVLLRSLSDKAISEEFSNSIFDCLTITYKDSFSIKVKTTKAHAHGLSNDKFSEKLKQIAALSQDLKSEALTQAIEKAIVSTAPAKVAAGESKQESKDDAVKPKEKEKISFPQEIHAKIQKIETIIAVIGSKKAKSFNVKALAQSAKALDPMGLKRSINNLEHDVNKMLGAVQELERAHNSLLKRQSKQGGAGAAGEQKRGPEQPKRLCDIFPSILPGLTTGDTTGRTVDTAASKGHFVKEQIGAQIEGAPLSSSSGASVISLGVAAQQGAGAGAVGEAKELSTYATLLRATAIRTGSGAKHSESSPAPQQSEGATSLQTGNPTGGIVDTAAPKDHLAEEAIGEQIEGVPHVASPEGEDDPYEPGSKRSAPG